jgi:hypothetical protein
MYTPESRQSHTEYFDKIARAVMHSRAAAISRARVHLHSTTYESWLKSQRTCREELARIAVDCLPVLSARLDEVLIQDIGIRPRSFACTKLQVMAHDYISERDWLGSWGRLYEVRNGWAEKRVVQTLPVSQYDGNSYPVPTARETSCEGERSNVHNPSGLVDATPLDEAKVQFDGMIALYGWERMKDLFRDFVFDRWFEDMILEGSNGPLRTPPWQ